MIPFVVTQSDVSQSNWLDINLLNLPLIHCYMIDFIVQVSSHFLQSALHCSYFISFPSVHTSLLIFHLISFSPHFIIHVSSHFFQCALYCSCFILFPSVHLIHFINLTPSHSHLLYLVAFIVHRHSTLLSVSLFGQCRLWKLTTYECL